jgi:hypothetical protein
MFGGSKEKVHFSGPSKVRFQDLGKLPAEVNKELKKKLGVPIKAAALYKAACYLHY